jgi:hypothetical protein
MLAFCDNTGEVLAATLRRGNAGSNTAADHIEVLDAALAQLPDQHRHGTPILVRADTAGCTREFLAHIRRLREQVVSCGFSVGWAITGKERAAIPAIPARVWADAIDADGGHRDGAALAEITRVLPDRCHRDARGRAALRLRVRHGRPDHGGVLAALALFGATLRLISGWPAVRAGRLRVGGAAALIVFGVGHLIGHGVS